MMIDQLLKASNKTSKNHDGKKFFPSSNIQGSSKKQSRKGEIPTRFAPATDHSSDRARSSSCICKNLSCKAVLSMDDSFCQRCSCCICHLYDDNKDPSLWLVCESLDPRDDSCGLTCHIECAFRHGKVGVVSTGQFMQLDGTYSCASCGNVSGILGFWKKQLNIAKDARRVDVLCYRISLSYRLLDGTSKFKPLHEIVKDVKSKLEAEVGPINGVSDKTGRGIVNRLSVAGDVQKLCVDAIQKADQWLANASNRASGSRADSLPATCRFLLEQVTSSSVAIVLIEIPTAFTDRVKGYKLWCFRGEEAFSNEPICSFPREHRRILISNLQPSTSYTFRIVSYMEAGDAGTCEARCVTKGLDTIHMKPNPSGTVNFLDTKANSKGTEEANGSPFGFKGVSGIGKDSRPVHELDLNANPPLESSRDEDNGCTLERAGADDDAASHGTEKNVGLKASLKRSFSANEETLDCDSALINGSPFKAPGALDESFEECVNMIRGLECEGHMEPGFRLKFLTWFCLRSTVQERCVVNTFIQALAEDPKSLAGQLVDTFSDIIASKRPKNS